MTKASKVNAAGPLSNAAGSAGLAFCNRAGGGGESHGNAKCLTSQTTIRRKIPQKLVDMRSFFIQDSSFGQNILTPPRADRRCVSIAWHKRPRTQPYRRTPFLK